MTPDPTSPETFVPPSTDELGAMLPAYDIMHLIAAGGMGAVYAGVQRALDRPVAIKILPPGAARDGESIDRFRTEAKAMARLTHANIPAVYDFDVSAGYCYLVMEFIDGWNVHQLITQKELQPDLTYSLLSQVCDALHYAHQRGIVHGDIKPSNLLVNQEGVVKLADFGLAQLIDSTSASDPDAFTPMGTPEYAAPELWQPGVTLDHRADLYSLGCVFYEMLTGAPPQGQFQLPSVPLKLDPRVDVVIARCMQASPNLRYQSAAEIKKAVEEIRQPAPRAGGPHRSPVRVVRPPARRPGASAPSGKRPAARKADGIPPLVWILLLIAVIAGVAYIIKTKAASSSSPANQAVSTAPGASAKISAASPPPDSPAPSTPPASDASIPNPTPPASPKTEPAAMEPPVAPAAEPTTPPVAPAAPSTLSPEVDAQRIAVLARHRADWQANVAGKLTTETDRLAAFYTSALEKLRDEFSKAKDESGLTALKEEADRFARTPDGLGDTPPSANEKVAALQKTLTTALASTRAKVKPAADLIREKCLLDLKKIEANAPPADQAILSVLYDKIVGTPDLAPVLVP
ncbi:MAG: prkC 34 [Verrucomicrobiales bacterium]|nr:prkC 34 [Verrucomicrobiales bacterium]